MPSCVVRASNASLLPGESSCVSILDVLQHLFEDCGEGVFESDVSGRAGFFAVCHQNLVAIEPHEFNALLNEICRNYFRQISLWSYPTPKQPRMPEDTKLTIMSTGSLRSRLRSRPLDPNLMTRIRSPRSQESS